VLLSTVVRLVSAWRAFLPRRLPGRTGAQAVAPALVRLRTWTHPAAWTACL